MPVAAEGVTHDPDGQTVSTMIHVTEVEPPVDITPDKAHIMDHQAQSNGDNDESLEAFVAEAENRCDLLARDVLNDHGDGEGVVASSFDNSLSPGHDDDEEASSLRSLRAELAQATPEKAGVVWIPQGSDSASGGDDDDNSGIGGGGSACFGDGGGNSEGAVATPKTSRHGRDQTPPKRRRSMGSASGGRRSSWLRLPGLSPGLSNNNNNVSTGAAAASIVTDAAGRPPLAQPVTALDHVLLDDMAKDDVDVVYESFPPINGDGLLEDVTAQSRALAAGVEAGLAAAAIDDSSPGAASFVTARSQFWHPLHKQTDKVDITHEGSKNAGGSDDSASKPPGLLILGDVATSIRSLSALGGADDNNSLSPSVSTMASSLHSGAVIPNPRSRISLLNDKLDAKLKLKMSRRRLLFEDEYYHDEDEIDWQLEEEIFAEEDAMNSIVLQEAHELMAQVNKSVSSMRLDPPFQPTEDILPSLKELHASLKYHLVESKAAGIVAEVELPRHDDVEKTSTRTMNESNAVSKKHMSKVDTGQDDALPALDDREAIVQFFMQRLKEASLKDDNSKLYRSERGVLDYQQFTAFLPNFLWYQPMSGDTSSIIRPTSLCSGTGIGSGLKYIDPEMMAIFALFGNYLAGALSEEERNPASANGKDESFRPRRSVRWLNAIDEDDDSDLDAESMHKSDDDAFGAGKGLKSEEVNGMVLSEEQMTVIQSAIDELLSKKMNVGKTSKIDAIGDERSEFHSAEKDSESGGGDFLVEFPQR